jgi:uncharacterized protein YegJ (DUF2314 family)
MRAKTDLVPVFMPMLRLVLLSAEDKKGSPLTEQEVLDIRDKAACIAMTREDAAKMEDTRGRDINPENCWFDFQSMRRELGRKPDLDPGARVESFPRGDPTMEEAMRRARRTLDDFDEVRSRLADSGAVVMIKTLVGEGKSRTYLWLDRVRPSRNGYVAQVFELPSGIRTVRVDEEIAVDRDAVADWLVNHKGTLHGGFTLRIHRADLTDAERKRFDSQLGVHTYA